MTMSVKDTSELLRLKNAFSEEMTRVFDAAYEVEDPAGTTPVWREICDTHGVASISDTERGQIRAAQRPLRGAAVMEVQDVVTAVIRDYRMRVKGIKVWNAPGDVEVFHEKLLSLLGRADTEFLSAYKKAVLPKPSGMFANVFSGQPAKAQASTGPTAVTIRCQNCGAPRLNDSDFVCAFCDGQMV